MDTVAVTLPPAATVVGLIVKFVTTIPASAENVAVFCCPSGSVTVTDTCPASPASTAGSVVMVNCVVPALAANVATEGTAARVGFAFDTFACRPAGGAVPLSVSVPTAVAPAPDVENGATVNVASCARLKVTVFLASEAPNDAVTTTATLLGTPSV